MVMNAAREPSIRPAQRLTGTRPVPVADRNVGVRCHVGSARSRGKVTTEIARKARRRSGIPVYSGASRSMRGRTVIANQDSAFPFDKPHVSCNIKRVIDLDFVTFNCSRMTPIECGRIEPPQYLKSMTLAEALMERCAAA